MMLRQRLRIGALLCLALFALTAALVMAGFAQAYDQALLATLRAAGQPEQADLPEWLVRSAIIVTSLGTWPVRLGAALLVGGVLVIGARRREAAVLVLSVAVAALALPLLKMLFGRARPDLAWRLADAANLSFPSGHAMGTMVTYPLAGLLLGRLARGGAGGRIGLVLGVALALLIGATRVLLGVHWASDVIGGWLLGGAWACISLALLVRDEPGAGGGKGGIAPGAAIGERRRDGDARC